MTPDDLHSLLEALKCGERDVEDVARVLSSGGVAHLGFARVDLDRERRQGAPEVIYGAGKQPEEIAAIAASLLE
ncbi:MAG: 1-(5-phosphoribosyl)-5-amino-4-imidazole-carboxylate carboxylase, partial [Myxococcota bacterium]